MKEPKQEGSALPPRVWITKTRVCCAYDSVAQKCKEWRNEYYVDLYDSGGVPHLSLAEHAQALEAKDREICRLKERLRHADACLSAANYPAYEAELTRLRELLAGAEAVVEKIADPRKRDHAEPDAYTQLGCVMNMANELLAKLRAERGEGDRVEHADRPIPGN